MVYLRRLSHITKGHQALGIRCATGQLTTRAPRDEGLRIIQRLHLRVKSALCSKLNCWTAISFLAITKQRHSDGGYPFWSSNSFGQASLMKWYEMVIPCLLAFVRKPTIWWFLPLLMDILCWGFLNIGTVWNSSKPTISAKCNSHLSCLSVWCPRHESVRRHFQHRWCWCFRDVGSWNSI